jgi:hypothetical protein
MTGSVTSWRGKLRNLEFIEVTDTGTGKCQLKVSKNCFDSQLFYSIDDMSVYGCLLGIYSTGSAVI